MNLIKVNNSKYDEYEILILERDQLKKEAGQIWTAYIQQFGQFITDVFEEKLECIKCKKMIAYYQNAINHGQTINPKDMQDYLEHEMINYYSKLNKMLEENELCRKSKLSTAYDVERSKMLYRRLAKLIHPDIFPETDHNDILSEFWERIVKAYGRNDVKELSEIDVLVRKVLAEIGDCNISVDIQDIENKIDGLKTEIEEIRHTEPYIHKYILEDDKAVEKYKAELLEKLETWKSYHKELNEVIETILKNGGITIKWTTS